jgi:TonB family protein
MRTGADVRGVHARGRRERRVWLAGLLASWVVHVLAFLVFRAAPPLPSTLAAAGPRAGDPRAAAGGGGMLALLLAPPRPIVVPPRPEAVVRVRPAEVRPLEETTPAFARATLRSPGEGEREGADRGPGLPGGEGRGDAGTDAAGLQRLVSPDPWGMITPPLTNIPPEARGRAVRVRVFVNEAGIVDSVRLVSATPSREYNERIIRQAYEWTFKPAQRGGRRVAAWFEYTLDVPR